MEFFRTNQAMSGSMTFRQSLTARLEIIQPTLQQIENFVNQHPAPLTPKIKYVSINFLTKLLIVFCRELVDTLHKRNVAVFLITGGFRSIVTPVAKSLRIADENVFANRMKFYFTGM